MIRIVRDSLNKRLPALGAVHKVYNNYRRTIECKLKRVRRKEKKSDLRIIVHTIVF